MTLAATYPLYVANRAEQPNHGLAVRDKFSGAVAAHVAMAGPADIERALAAAWAARDAMRRLPPFARRAVLDHCVARFEARREELAQALCVEAGKPIRDSRGEVTRLIDTFRVAAEESLRIGGEVLPLDVTARTRGYSGYTRRVPAGVCSFITPFNFPLNLVAHKVAPAIAAGCPFVLKPASATPLGALIIGAILAETDLPAGAFSILPCPGSQAGALVSDERIAHVSFTGSPAVGWGIKTRAAKAKVTLELGGNAAVIVDADVTAGAGIEDAVQRIVFGAFYQSGQSCIAVQRIIAHEAIYDELKTQLLAATRALKVGDPRDEATFIGPLIDVREAERLENWIAAAVQRGAKLLCGGKRDGALLDPALLENAPRDCEIVRHEAFGPVAVLSRFDDFEAALAEVNDSAYGLQAGVFTRDIYKARRAWDELEVGGVVIGDVPSWRVDHMPYGGVKNSGLGREGVRYAIEEMSEPRLLVVRER